MSAPRVDPMTAASPTYQDATRSLRGGIRSGSGYEGWVPREPSRLGVLLGRLFALAVLVAFAVTLLTIQGA